MLYLHCPWRSGAWPDAWVFPHCSFLGFRIPLLSKNMGLSSVICLIVFSSPFAPFSLSGTLDIVTSGMAVSILQTSLFFPFMISIYAVCLCSALEMVFLIDLS